MSTALPPMNLTWIKATASMGTGACVELAVATETIFVRNSRYPDGPALAYTRDEISAFLDGAKKGEFDHLAAPR
jgi:hypothetical protein